jgi:hypothetical protein
MPVPNVYFGMVFDTVAQHIAFEVSYIYECCWYSCCVMYNAHCKHFLYVFPVLGLTRYLRFLFCVIMQIHKNCELH